LDVPLARKLGKKPPIGIYPVGIKGKGKAAVVSLMEKGGKKEA
jgi:hypothetical protein